MNAYGAENEGWEQGWGLKKKRKKKNKARKESCELRSLMSTTLHLKPNPPGLLFLRGLLPTFGDS
jgi:hypothetical protein